jgi:diadenosine tetraphosphate (Ap4A) HIT family hydrolase
MNVMTIAESYQLDLLNKRLEQRMVIRRMHEKDESLHLEEALKAGVAPWTDKVYEDFHVVAFRDAYPVTEGHLLFVPQYYADGVIWDCFRSALEKGREMVKEGKCDGFNIGFNNGVSAGQTVMWPHVHLIPRRSGDAHDPVGGVRNVIPYAGNYKRKVGWLKRLFRFLGR